MTGRFMPWTLGFSLAAHAAALLLLPSLTRQADRAVPLVASLRLLPAGPSATAAARSLAANASETARKVPAAGPRAERRLEPVPGASQAIARRPNIHAGLQREAKAAPARTETFAMAAPGAERLTRPVSGRPAPTAPGAAERAAGEQGAPLAATSTASAISTASPSPGASTASGTSVPGLPASPAASRGGVALDDYGRALADILSHQQQYPRLAALRGWEGEVRLRLKVARKGNLVAVQVVHSSGHEVLDQHALQLVQGTALPHPPDALGEGEIQVIVPIHYKLQKPT